MEDEPEKQIIVALRHAVAQPVTMMIKFHHTVVADVTVRAPQRPEYIACVAEFELKEHR